MYELSWYDVMTFKNTTHILWTLPVEIQYYFIIPIYCLVIAYSGRHAYRLNAVILVAVSYVSLVRPRFVHQPLSVHWPTFVTGSACGVLWVQVSKFIEKRPPKKFAILGIQCFSLFLVLLIISNVCHQFFWTLLKKDPFAIGSHFQFTSLFLGILLITETCFPSDITNFFEWSLLQFLGKACFPIYLLHSATYATIHQLPNWDGFICYIIGLTLVGKLGLMVEKLIDNVCVKLCKVIDSSTQFERVVTFADQSRKNISNSILKKAGKRIHQLGLTLQNKIPEMA
jgi:peptidoglycan/LPS O-acetylase OafA/YrhL